MRTLVNSDPHGNYKGLIQALERAGFDKDKDMLIQLGDCVDGYPDSYEIVEFLVTLPHCVCIRGNHDEAFLNWIITGSHTFGWRHGAVETLNSYSRNLNKEEAVIKMSGLSRGGLEPSDLPESHIKFFKEQLPYYIDDKNRIFVHGGFNRHFHITEQQTLDIFWWDRDLWLAAMAFDTITKPLLAKYKFKTKDRFSEIFIGHTATIQWAEDDVHYTSGLIIPGEKAITTPMNCANVWNVDTGGGYKQGKVTVMDIDTKEFFQSDFGHELYPDNSGR